MPKIPTYESQSNLQNITSRVSTESGRFDTITNPEAVWQGVGKMGNALQALGDMAVPVVERVRRMNEADVDLALESRIQNVETDLTGMLTDIETKTGLERVQSVDDYNKYKGNVNIFDTSSIKDDSNYLEKKLKKYGVNEHQKAQAQNKIQAIFDRIDSRVTKLHLEAREFVNIQSVQKTVNNTTIALEKNVISFDEALERIHGSVENKDISPEKARYMLDSSIQLVTKTYLERGIEVNNPEIIRDTLAGKYDQYLIGTSGDKAISNAGTSLITSLKEDALKAQSANKVNAAVGAYSQMIQEDVFNNEIWDKAQREINKSKLTPEEKRLTINALNIERNRKQSDIREARVEGQRVESENYYKLVQENKHTEALEYLNKAKWITIEDKLAKEKALRSGAAIATDKQTLFNIRSHVLENIKDVEGNKKLIFDNMDKLSTNDMESILNKAISGMQEVEGKMISRNYKLIESQVAPHNSMLGLNNTPGENENLKKALDSFDDLVGRVKQKDSDKYIDQETMNSIAEHVIATYKPTVKQQLDWKKEESGSTDKARKKGETIQQYKERTSKKQDTSKDAGLKSEAVALILSQNEKPEFRGKKIPLTEENIKKTIEYLKRRGP